MNLYRCMRSFVSVIEQKSFAKAARELYRSASQITKEINWLESELGVVLLHRTTRKLRITESGEEFYHYAQRTLTEYNNVKEQLRSQQDHITGKLVVTMPPLFAQFLILDHIPDFMRTYPQITLDLRLANRYIDLVAEKIDLAMRIDDLSKKVYWHKPFIKTQRGVFASPNYLKKHGTPKTINELANHQCLLHNEMTNPYLWTFKNNQQISVNGRYLCNDPTSLINMAINDFGLIYLGRHVVMSHLNNDELIEILQDFAPEPTQIIFCTPKQDFIPKKIHAFIDYFLALYSL